MRVTDCVCDGVCVPVGVLLRDWVILGVPEEVTLGVRLRDWVTLALCVTVEVKLCVAVCV